MRYHQGAPKKEQKVVTSGQPPLNFTYNYVLARFHEFNPKKQQEQQQKTQQEEQQKMRGREVRS